jgi:hypothetical protein
MNNQGYSKLEELVARFFAHDMPGVDVPIDRSKGHDGLYITESEAVYYDTFEEADEDINFVTTADVQAGVIGEMLLILTEYTKLLGADTRVKGALSYFLREIELVNLERLECGYWVGSWQYIGPNKKLWNEAEERTGKKNFHDKNHGCAQYMSQIAGVKNVS